MATAQGLIYSLVARGTNVLSEYAVTDSGNYITVSRVVLEKIPPVDDTRQSYVYDQYAFHYMVVNGVIFLCMTDLKMQRRTALGFLEDIQGRFFSMYTAAQVQHASAYALNDFASVLKKQMYFFTYDPSVDKLAVVKKQIEDTKAVMMQNIEEILERGEKFDILVDQTDDLETQSFHFKKQSNKLYWAVIRKNIKLIILIAIILVICIWLATSMLCGFTYACLSFL